MTKTKDPKRWLVLLAVIMAFMPVVLDMTILHVAVPSLTQALGASNTEVLWIIDIYPLLMAGLLVPMGTLADRIGNRRLMLTGLAIFAGASACAAFAPTAPVLIAARVALALGGAMIVPCVLGLIRRTFEDETERGMALGIWGTVGSAGAAVGPLVGGALLESFWWGSAFLMNLPVMAIVWPLCWLLLPRHEEKTPGKWSIGQALMLIAGLIGVVYAVKAGFAGKAEPLLVWVILAAGLALLAWFARLQLRSAQPMLDLSLFARPAILAGIVMALVASGSLAGVELTLAQELQYVLGKSPLEAGLFMIPIMGAAAVGGPLAGWLSAKLGLRLVAVTSLALAAGALTQMAVSDFHDPGLVVPIVMALLGLSLSVGLTSSSIAIMGAVETSKAGAAGSLEATGYELGTGLGITFFGVFLSTLFARNYVLPEGIPAEVASLALRSIGDTYLAAASLAPEQATALIEAGQQAFSSSHTWLLLTAASLIAVLAMVVFFLLARATKPSEQ